MLADELTLCDSSGTGKEATAGMGDELVEHVVLRQLVENLDEARPGVALITYKEEAGVIFHALAPRRPALGGEIHSVIV